MNYSENQSSTKVLPKSKKERRLENIQLKFAREALDAFKNQGAFQRLQQAVAPQAITEIGQFYDPYSVLTDAERRDLVTRSYQDALAGSAAAGSISQSELDRIRRGGLATPEQQAAINEVARQQYESGAADIGRMASQQREAVSTELAPRLGLHRYDTPILDRANRIGGEAVAAAGKLASDIRANAAQQMLAYPLAASQANLAQQQIGYSRADVLSDLNQRAFQNRLQLTGQIGQQGLGLATGYNVPAAQQSLKPVTGQESSGYGFGFAMGGGG